MFYWLFLFFRLIIFWRTVNFDVNSAISAWELNVFHMKFFIVFLLFLMVFCDYLGEEEGV